MRAVVLDEYGSLDNLAIRDMPDPEPGSDDVVIDVKATAVNYVDLVLIGGTYQFKPDLPFVPGKGPSGIVHAAGVTATITTPRAGRIRRTRRS